MVKIPRYVVPKPILSLIIGTALFTVSHVELGELSSNNVVQIGAAAFAQTIPVEGPIKTSKAYHETGLR